MAKGKKSSKPSGAHNPTTKGGPDSVRGNLGALITEVQKSNSLIEASVDFQMTSTRGIEILTDVIGDMEANVAKIAEVMAGNRLKEMEADKERQKQMEDLLNALKKKDTPQKEQKKGDFSWLGLAATLVAGIVAGGLAFVKNYLKGLQTFWMSIAKSLKVDGIIVKIFETIKGTFTGLVDIVKGGFTKAWTFVKGLLGEMKWIESVREFITGIGKYFVKIFNLGEIGKDLEQLWTSMKGIWEMMGKPLKFLGEIFGGGGKGLLSVFDEMLTFFKPLLGFFKGLGAILGKLALPLQVIMSVFDTVSGALDGWEKTEGTFIDKLFGAIKGGISGLLNGLIGGLLDLLKDCVSWIAEALGFKDAAAWLDSFKFTDMITNAVNAVGDFVKGLVNHVIEFFQNGPAQAVQAIANFVSDTAKAAQEVLKSLLRTVLPDPSKGLAQKLASKAIPDAIYEFAGMDPKTGALKDSPKQEAPAPAAPPALVAKEAVVPPPAQETLQQAQDRLNKAQAEGEMSKAEANVEKMKLGLRPSFGRVKMGQDMSAPAVPISSSTTKWDPEDAMARGAMPY